jgi:hypothetical protein
LNFSIYFPLWPFFKLMSNVGEEIYKKQSDFHCQLKMLSHFNRIGLFYET